jgi:hypothetical protein
MMELFVRIQAGLWPQAVAQRAHISAPTGTPPVAVGPARAEKQNAPPQVAS